jgi:surfactin synthase thioesterase subunit
VFRRWQEVFGERAEIATVQLPGRETRLAEPAVEDIPTLARQLAGILDRMAKPFVLFGHSLGALVAYEIACVMVADGMRRPSRLVLAGARPPGHPAIGTGPVPADDRELVQQLRDLGGTPDEVFDNVELMELVLPSLRADLRAIDDYRPSRQVRVPIPVALVAGADDRHAPPDVVRRWREWVSADSPVHVLPGGHFFVHESDNVAAIRELALVGELRVAAPGRAGEC